MNGGAPAPTGKQDDSALAPPSTLPPQEAAIVHALHLTIRPLDIAAVVAVVTIWTLFLVLARFGVKGSFTPWDLAFIRFSFAAAVVLPVWLRRPSGQRLGNLTPARALAVATTAGLLFTCLAYSGFSFAPAAHGAVLMTGTLPFWVALVAWLVLDDKLSQRKVVSLALILLGVGFTGWHSMVDSASTVHVGNAAAGAWRGDVLFPFAAASWAVFVVLVRRWQVSAMDATVATALISFVLYAPVYLLFLPQQIMAAPLLEILWQGVFQGILALVVSMWLYTRVVQVFGPSRTTMITALCPGLAALIAVPVLGEPLSALILLGLAAVTAGMVLGVTGGDAVSPVTAGTGAAPRTQTLV